MHWRSVLDIQQQCNNKAMPTQSAEPTLSRTAGALSHCWPRGLSDSRLGLGLFCHLTEQLLKIGAVAQRVQIRIGLASSETGKTIYHGSFQSRHGSRAINLPAQTISRAKVFFIYWGAQPGQHQSERRKVRD